MEDQFRQRCVVCDCYSVAVSSNYSLITGIRGWRTLVTTDASGRRSVSFYCSPCWTRRKDTRRRAG